jgi:PIN domain nuclease of toxin-antitoxin system
MSALVDTQILIWFLREPERLSASVREQLTKAADAPMFSAISIWEVSIKVALGRADFDIEPGFLRSHLLTCGWIELPFTGAHAMAVRHLPPIHADPFDRALLAQAVVEGMDLVTADRALIAYGAPARGM